jgi:prevent-host-death family protein
MSITATELKQNLGKYLMISATEDVFITKNGKVVAKLSNPYQDM